MSDGLVAATCTETSLYCKWMVIVKALVRKEGTGRWRGAGLKILGEEKKSRRREFARFFFYIFYYLP